MPFLNECQFRAVSGGLTDFVVASAITGWYTPAGCTNPTVVDGGVYHWRAESDDGTQYESFEGSYTVATTTIARTTVIQSSNGGAKVNFSAAPRVRQVALEADIKRFHDTFENVTIVAGASAANPDKFRTNITSDNSGGAQTITLGALDVDEFAGRLHLFVFASQSDPGDTIDIAADNGIVGGDVIALPTEEAWALFQFTRNGWLPLTFGGDATISVAGTRYAQLSDEGVSFWDFVNLRPDENVDLSISTTASPVSYVTFITTDGSAGPQSINLEGVVPDRIGAFHLFRLQSQLDPADVVEITADAGIVNSEVITLTAAGSWALFELTANGWLPWTFGGGTTTSRTVDLGLLQLFSDGSLAWTGTDGAPINIIAVGDGAGVIIEAGSGTGGGSIEVTAGTSSAADGADVVYNAGDSSSNNGGKVRFQSGSGDIDGGEIAFTSGAGVTGNGGKLTFSPGPGDVDGGDAIFELPSAGSGRQGLFFITGLPTSDPGVSGALWSDSGTIKISP